MTKKGDGTYGKPCVFPWTDPVTGEQYTKCVDKYTDMGSYWCPTEVGENSLFDLKLSGDDKWGYCSDECPKAGLGLRIQGQQFRSVH